MKRCTRCIMPETQEGITFDEFGVCAACQSQEQKMTLDWPERRKALDAILSQAKEDGARRQSYDCLLPISGGKDSFFQAHVLVKEYGLRPLAVTFCHGWMTDIGKRNLENLLTTFDLDHIQFTPAKGTIAAIARKSLELIGDACWHCHAGVGAFPLQVAVAYNIPLLVWGESVSEASGRATYEQPAAAFDRDYFTRVSAKKDFTAMEDDETPRNRLQGFIFPSADACVAAGVHGIHLGDYLYWDDERQMEFVQHTYGWKPNPVPISGTYKNYKSVECRMAGVHDYCCYLKRGYGRGTYQASCDIRAGLLTREQAIELAEKHESPTPPALEEYLTITGITEQEFRHAMNDHRRRIFRNEA